MRTDIRRFGPTRPSNPTAKAAKSQDKPEPWPRAAMPKTIASFVRLLSAGLRRTPKKTMHPNQTKVQKVNIVSPHHPTGGMAWPLLPAAWLAPKDVKLLIHSFVHLRKNEKSRCENIWRTVYAMFTVWQKQRTYPVRNKVVLHPHRSDWNKILKLCYHCLSISCQHGADALATHVKEWSLQAYKQAIGDIIPDHPQVPSLAKFLTREQSRLWKARKTLLAAGMGRALPLPPPSTRNQKDARGSGHYDKNKALSPPKGSSKNGRLKLSTPAHPASNVVSEALQRHKISLSKPGPKKDASLAQKLTDFVARKIRYARQRSTKVDPTDARWVPLPSTSACIEASVREGGSYSYIWELSKRAHTHVGEHPSARAKRFAATIRAELHWLRNQWKSARNRHPQGVVHALPERGWKARILSKHNAALVEGLKPINRSLLHCLRKLRPSAPALRGASVTASLKRMPWHTSTAEQYVFSGDLSTASDLIPFWVARATVDGICSGMDWGPYHKALLYNATGPFRLDYPDNTTLTTQRGCLMGLPSTWPILSFINMFAAEHLTSKRDRNFYRVVGDDIVGVWSEETVMRYKLNLDSMGLVLNARKTGESPDRGVLAEEYFELIKRRDDPLPYADVSTLFPKRPGKPAIQSWADTDEADRISRAHPEGWFRGPRSLIRPRLSAIVTAKRSADPTNVNRESTPVEFALGDILTEQTSLPTLPAWQRERILAVGLAIHKRSTNRLRKAGIPLFWPKAFGGAGLPGKQRAPVKHRILASAMVSYKVTDANPIQSAVKHQWTSKPASPAEAKVAQELRAVLDKERRTKHKAGYLVDSVRQSLLGRALVNEILNGTILRTQKYHKWAAWAAGRQLKRIVNATAKSHQHRHPINARNATKLAARHSEERLPAKVARRLLDEYVPYSTPLVLEPSKHKKREFGPRRPMDRAAGYRPT